MIGTMRLPLPSMQPPGRTHKPRGERIMARDIECQSRLRELADEITFAVVALRAIGMEIGEKPAGGSLSPYTLLAMRIDRRVRLLLSVDWELKRAMELIDEYLPYR
jgi:hypothetical protein